MTTPDGSTSTPSDDRSGTRDLRDSPCQAASDRGEMSDSLAWRVTTIADGVGASVCAVYLHNWRGELQAAAAVGLRLDAQPIPAAMLVPDVTRFDSSDPDPEVTEWMRAVDLGSAVVAPIREVGQQSGALLLGQQGAEPFPLEVDAIARTVAELASSAFELEWRQTEQRVEAAASPATSSVAKALAAGARVEHILDELALAAREMAGADTCWVELIDEESRDLELVASASAPGWVDPDVTVGRRSPLAVRSASVGALETGRVLQWDGVDELIDDEELVRHAAAGAQSLLVVPMRAQSQQIGLFTLFARAPMHIVSARMDAVLEFAAEAALAVSHTRLQTKLRRSADLDALTELLNHRAILAQIDSSLRLAEENEKPLSVVLIDIGGFTLFNETRGHPAGDRVLTGIARLLERICRTGDVIGRYGGDEFVMVLPGAGVGDAEAIAKRVLQVADDTAFVINDERLPISLALGIATFPDDGRSRTEMMDVAVEAVGEAKAAGPGRFHRGRGTLQIAGEATSALAVLDGLVSAVDRKDRYTRQHSDIVTEAAVRTAQLLGLGPQAENALRIAGPIHDVGKIAVPDSILLKPSALTAEERAIMQQHVEFGLMLIRDVPQLHDVIDAVLHHHERWDGNGYPNRKSGESIPLLGRIMAVADAYSAMIADRPYRKGLDQLTAFEELRRGAGTQFDAELVEPFITAMFDPPNLRQTARLNPREILTTSRFGRPGASTGC